MSLQRARRKVLMAVMGVALLAGCAPETDAQSLERPPMSRSAWIQPLPDGGEVVCVYASGGSGGGITCDWGNATRNNEAGERLDEETSE